jgi:hypothetical protein
VRNESVSCLGGLGSRAQRIRIAPHMKHGEHDQQIAANTKVDAKRKSTNAYPADARNDFPASLRRRTCAKQGTLYFRLKVAAESKSLLFVPAACRDVLEKRLPPERGCQIHFPPEGGVRRLMLSQETTSSGYASSSSSRACSSARWASESCIAAESSASMLFQISSMSAKRCSTSSLSKPNFFSDSDTTRTLHPLSMRAKPWVARSLKVRLHMPWPGSTTQLSGFGEIYDRSQIVTGCSQLFDFR